MVTHLNKQKFGVHWTIFVKICWKNLHFDLKYVITRLTPHFNRILRGINEKKKSHKFSSFADWKYMTSIFGFLLAEIEFEIWA